MADQKEYPLFSEENSVEAVNERMGGDIDPRLKEVMGVLVKHLHEAVKEVEPTHEEWMQAIQFLTQTGHMCTDWRQEFILLSDILGVSMLVESINHRRGDSGATENTILGPFYVDNAPEYERGADICLDHKGEPAVVFGAVKDVEGNPIANAKIDVWQTNDDGFYDVQQKGIQPDFNLRGIFRSDPDGTYRFKTVRPRFYPIPDDGPVGKLLRQMGRHQFRAAHIHVIVSAPGFDTIVTHLFDPECQYLREDTVFGVKDSLVAAFERKVGPGEGEDADMNGDYWSVNWDFVLSPAKAN